MLNPANPDNQAGFWEPLDIVEIHEEILASAGSSWDDPRAFPSSWYETSEAQAYEDQVVSFLQREFSCHNLCAVKDPRICRLIPLWVLCLKRIGAEPLYVLPVRNPLEAAMSLGKRNGFSEYESLGLWLRHFLEAERGSRGSKRTVVGYDHLLSDWSTVTAKMAADLGVNWPRSVAEAAPEIEAFLSVRHRHFLIDPVAVFNRRDIPVSVKKIYSIAMTMAEGHDVDLVEFDRVYGNLDELLGTFGLGQTGRPMGDIPSLIDELERTREESARARGALSYVLDSRSWRWTKPLRTITSNVRAWLRC
jgi:hypothetical protein